MCVPENDFYSVRGVKEQLDRFRTGSLSEPFERTDSRKRVGPPITGHLSHDDYPRPRPLPPVRNSRLMNNHIPRSLELLVAFTAEERERGGKCEQDGGVEGGAVLRTVLWKSEQWQQHLGVSRQAD